MFDMFAEIPHVSCFSPRHCGQKREDVDAFRQYCSEVISGVSDARPQRWGVPMVHQKVHV